MNRIIILDTINERLPLQTVRLKKIYNITLLNIFPKVLETVIHEYVDDIIETTMTLSKIRCDIEINNQYINCTPISFRIRILLTNIINAEFLFDKVSDNIAYVSNSQYPHQYEMLAAKYMKVEYGKKQFLHNYWNTDLLHYEDNSLSYWYDRSDVLALEIHIRNHRLFKNMLVIINCFYKEFHRSLLRKIFRQ